MALLLVGFVGFSSPFVVMLLAQSEPELRMWEGRLSIFDDLRKHTLWSISGESNTTPRVFHVPRFLREARIMLLFIDSNWNRFGVHCTGPPLWSSAQRFWIQIQRSWFDYRRHQIFWEVLGLERGPLSLVNATEELLGRNDSGSGLENRDYGRRGSAALTTRHPSIHKSWH
jgi:hypothetical protein